MCNSYAEGPGTGATTGETAPPAVDVPVQGGGRAINIERYLKTLRPKRTIRAKQYEDFVHKNIVENSVNNNSKCFQPIHAKSDNYKNSFFPRTVLEWNNLSDSIVNKDSIDSFKSALISSD